MALNPPVNINGKVVNVFDRVTVLGTVVSVSGTGSLAIVTVQSPLMPNTYTVQANDMSAVQNGPNSAVSKNGKQFGTIYDQVSVQGVVTAISGQGNTALLTITLTTSGATLTGIPSGACQSDNF